MLPPSVRGHRAGGATPILRSLKDCGGPWLYASACEEVRQVYDAKTTSTICTACRLWAGLDRTISEHVPVNGTISGGIFLYELQAAKILSLLESIVKRRGTATVCETGFNAGHSALLFLSVPNTTVISFDRFDRIYQQEAVRYLTQGETRSYPLTTHHAPLTTHHSLLTTYYSLLTTHYSLLTAHCSLFTAHCSLPTAHCSLLTAHCSLLTAHCSLLTTHYSLLTAH